MKFTSVFLFLLSLILPAAGQGREEKEDIRPKEEKLTKWDVEGPESIADGTPAKPVAKSVPIDFKVISSLTKKVDVVEAPEIPGLPPVTGEINVTVRMVEDPNLPDSPDPLPALEVSDPAVVARMAELQKSYQGTSLIFISASVYDHKRTLLRIHTNGEDGSEVFSWTNLDLNHFSGFATYRVKDAVDGTAYEYGILMGIGNESTQTLAKLAALGGVAYEAPKIPELPDLEDGGPAFVVMEGEPESSAMATLEQIHDLYRKDGKRMEAAYHAREKAHAERKAYLLANPAKPDDVTISFWKRNPRSAVSPEKPSLEKSR